MTDILVGGLILAVLGAIIFYLVRARRRGQKCIGCPYGGKCSGNCSSAKNQHQ